MTLRPKSGILAGIVGLSFGRPVDTNKPFLTLYWDFRPSEFRSYAIRSFIGKPRPILSVSLESIEEAKSVIPDLT